jgi:hypothetical protein
MGPQRPRREVGCPGGMPLVVLPWGANPNPGTITDEMWWLWQQLSILEPGSQLGGIYANKPGYHGTRNQNSPSNYSVTDPPDQGGPGDKAGAIDWTFPEAQLGDYATIDRYTSRLLASAQDPDDPRLNGWREFYGQADADSYVEGWDTRYGYAVTSDSSHLWHIHLSENRDQTTSLANKQALLSVLSGQTVADWREGDVSAKDVWDFDIDPTSSKYTAGGAQKVTMDRTGYLANEFAPAVLTAITDQQQMLDSVNTRLINVEDELELGAEQRRGLGHALALLLVLVIMLGGATVALLLLD